MRVTGTGSTSGSLGSDPGFIGYQLCASEPATPCFSFSICKMRVMLVSYVIGKFREVNEIYEVLETVSGT